jgi:hypothetical protein
VGLFPIKMNYNMSQKTPCLQMLSWKLHVRTSVSPRKLPLIVFITPSILNKNVVPEPWQRNWMISCHRIRPIWSSDYQFPVSNAKWLNNGKLRKAILSGFYNISQRNFGILLILWCSFKLWWNFCPGWSRSKFHS